MLDQPPPWHPTELYIAPTDEEKNLAMLSHLTAMLGAVFGGGFLGFLGPLIIWQTQKDKSRFVNYHSVQSLNHQITFLLAYVILGALTFVGMFFCVGILFIIPLIGAWITSLVFEILASMQATRGEWTRIPFSFPFVK
jgi:uncharacterized Tic20 family protein